MGRGRSWALPEEVLPGILLANFARSGRKERAECHWHFSVTCAFNRPFRLSSLMGNRSGNHIFPKTFQISLEILALSKRCSCV